MTESTHTETCLWDPVSGVLNRPWGDGDKSPTQGGCLTHKDRNGFVGKLAPDKDLRKMPEDSNAGDQMGADVIDHARQLEK